MSTSSAEGIAFIRANRRIAWSLAYLGVAASLIGVLGAIGPGFATDILRLRPEDFFFIMGPAGLGAVVGILFLNSYGKGLPKRLVIDIGLVAMGLTLIAAGARPADHRRSFGPAVSPIEDAMPVDRTARQPHRGRGRDRRLRRPGVRVRRHPIADRAAGGAAGEVRGRIFGILNTLLSVASFLPVIAAPAAADLLNIFFDGMPASRW